MEAHIKPSRIHPLVAGAAVSVMLVSATGIAAMTGLLPDSHGGDAPLAQLAAPAATTASVTSPARLAQAPAQSPDPAQLEESAREEKPAPAARPDKAVERPAPAKKSQPPRTAYSDPMPAARPPGICYSCGLVESVQAIRQPAQGSGVGMVAGAVLGGVLGNQVGGGNGRKLATVAGAVGGGYAGNEIEKRTRATTSYQVSVRMEDGKLRTFSYADQPAWSTGDRVRVVDGRLQMQG